jgi:Phosphotransferase enzyme family
VPRAVSVQDDVVVKLQEPATSRRERLRTGAARVVAQNSGLFHVPEIISFDDARGSIVFQRVPGTGLQQALLKDERSLELVTSAAQALAAVHRTMEPPEADAHLGTPRVSWADPGRSVPLHGDFGLTNVLCQPASSRIAIIDWSNASWIGYDGDLGPPELDLSVFLISLFHRRIFGPRPLARRHDVARHFLRTYASASPMGVDVPMLRSIVASTSPAFVRLTRRLRGRTRALAYRHSLIDLNFFLRRLPRAGGM